MDGIKKKPLPIRHQTIRRPVNNPSPSFTHSSSNTKREVLFISHQEAQQMESSKKERHKRKGWRKLFWLFASIFLIALLIYGIFFAWKAIVISRKINGESKQTTLVQNMRALVSPIVSSGHPLRGQETGRVNILLLGTAGQHKPGGNLTDTIMVMSIDTKNNKVALLSLPRDFFITIPHSNVSTKINSLYPIGIKEGQGADLIKAAVEKITGITLNYYVVVDFDGFEKIIDDIGGVNITSERDIYDPTYPGPNYSYQTFSLSKGFHTLDGATALKYVRERHDDPEGDFGRAKRQQQVMQAVKNKMFSMQTFFNVSTLNDILNTLGDNIKTDISMEEIGDLIALSKKLDLQNINNVVVDAWKPESLLKVSHVQMGAANAFVLLPKVGNYSEIQELAANIFDQSEIKKRRDLIVAEDANVTIINQSNYPGLDDKIRKLLIQQLAIKNVSISNANNEALADQTTVIDNSGGKKLYTLDELIKKIPAKLGGNAEHDANSDLTIILGNDIVDTYKYEDANLEEYTKAQEQEE